jgi:anti-sigma factor RsiW
LKSHIDACPTCRVAFERERSLFADIDTSLRATANAELPASFLPSVRARLVEFEAPRSTTFSARVAFAAACAAIVVLVDGEQEFSAEFRDIKTLFGRVKVET